MSAIKSFQELSDYIKSGKNGGRKRMAVANPVDDHSIEATMHAVDEGIVEAYLVGDAAIINEKLKGQKNIALAHVVDVKDPQEACVEAVRMVKEGECDILMKGLVNTDVILRVILNKEHGLLPKGRVLTYNSILNIPGYHKLAFFTDPAVIPAPTKEQRIEMIKYALNTARRFGVEKPNVALLHATEKANPKIAFMQDYLDIIELWKNEPDTFGPCIIDGPMDVFIAMDKERGAIKGVPTPILGEADVLMFPDFQSANCFYKGLVSFGGAGMAGMLQGTEKPVVLNSRSDSAECKFYSICMAAIMA
ncbi:MAG: phosphate butyryltransferase [Paludibacteraceae bacterium]|nr:phosphate butyryltransferase [Paludibacteraceae bacterium]